MFPDSDYGTVTPTEEALYEAQEKLKDLSEASNALLTWLDDKISSEMTERDDYEEYKRLLDALDKLC